MTHLGGGLAPPWFWSSFLIDLYTKDNIIAFTNWISIFVLVVYYLLLDTGTCGLVGCCEEDSAWFWHWHVLWLRFFISRNITVQFILITRHHHYRHRFRSNSSGRRLQTSWAKERVSQHISRQKSLSKMGSQISGWHGNRKEIKGKGNFSAVNKLMGTLQLLKCPCKLVKEYKLKYESKSRVDREISHMRQKCEREDETRISVENTEERISEKYEENVKE